MTAFVDASVLVAVILREPGWEDLDARLSGLDSLITSPIAIWEAVRAVVRETGSDVWTARDRVERLVGTIVAERVPIGAPEEQLALDAMARYGKGLGHPARLNLGDCFAYACAKTHGAALFYKGEDFAQTDIATA